ncbi:hypothetical protein HJFPF1_04333 [Paramyrothecium foliicola]|nr:hypothetical protein HJFPF1_04333 [Paramyrothecium foliicola]
MRPTLLLAFASIWPWAAAFGVRGAGERAMFYAAYVAEEVWEDDAKYTVGTGCVGTRDHVRLGSAKKRCTLEEFLLHMWEPTEANLLDTDRRTVLRDSAGNVIQGPDAKPDPANMARHFSQARNRASKELERGTVVNMRNSIMNYKEDLIPGDSTRADPAAGARPANTFVGNLRPGSIFSSLDYFETLEQFGNRLQPTQDRITEILNTPRPSGDLTDAQKKFEDETKPMLRRWQKQVFLGAEAVRYLRISDTSKHSRPAIRNELRPPLQTSHFRQKTVNAPAGVDQDGRPFNFAIPPWQEADREATIQAAVDDGVPRADAENAYNAALARVAATPEAITHQRAIDGINASSAALRC